MYVIRTAFKKHEIVDQRGSSSSLPAPRSSVKLSMSPELEDSVVYLENQQDTSILDDKESIQQINRNFEITRSECLWIGKNLLFVSSISILGFVQSIIGIYGEGQFV